MSMDVVDFEIKGSEMQFVEVELDPGEAAIGEAGSMMFMDAGIGMDSVFGDGSAQQGGFFGKLLGAGKRLVTGESLFTTVYTNQSTLKQRVGCRLASTSSRSCRWASSAVRASSCRSSRATAWPSCTPGAP